MCTHRGGLSATTGGGAGAGAAQQAEPAARGRSTTLDLTANTDHRRAAQSAPRQVAAYLDAVNNGAFSRPRMTGSGDVVRTLNPDSAGAGIQTGLRAHVIDVYTSPSSSFRRAEITDSGGNSLGHADYHSGGLATAEAAARRLLATELRRRGIY